MSEQNKPLTRKALRELREAGQNSEAIQNPGAIQNPPELDKNQQSVVNNESGQVQQAKQEHSGTEHGGAENVGAEQINAGKVGTESVEAEQVKSGQVGTEHAEIDTIHDKFHAIKEQLAKVKSETQTNAEPVQDKIVQTEPAQTPDIEQSVSNKTQAEHAQTITQTNAEPVQTVTQTNAEPVQDKITQTEPVQMPDLEQSVSNETQSSNQSVSNEVLTKNASQNLTKKTKTGRSIFTFMLGRLKLNGIVLVITIAVFYILQGVAFNAGFKTEKIRADFINGLIGNPIVNFFYGEPVQAQTIGGYMTWRFLPFSIVTVFIVSLVYSVNIFRGYEEDGQTELLLSNPIRKFKLFLVQNCAGLLVIGVSAIISGSIVGLCGEYLSGFDYGFLEGFVGVMPIFLCALLGFMIGGFTSQIFQDKSTARGVSLILAIVFFILRALGNSLDDFRWLKDLTPFGWAEKIHPLTNETDYIWFIPLIALPIILFILAALECYSRDLFQGMIKPKNHFKSHFLGTNSIFGSSFRFSSKLISIWTVVTIGYATMIAACVNTMSNTLLKVPNFSNTIEKVVTGNNAEQNSQSIEQAKLAIIHNTFLSVIVMFTGLLLVIFVGNLVGLIKKQESAGYLDNLLVRSATRVYYIIGRIIQGWLAVVLITAASLVASYGIVVLAGITPDFKDFVLKGMNVIGPCFLAFGIGLLLFGFFPVISNVIVYAWLAGSFIYMMLDGVFHFWGWTVQLSFFNYLSSTPATDLNHKHFFISLGIGIAFSIIGVIGFAKRDIQS